MLFRSSIGRYKNGNVPRMSAAMSKVDTLGLIDPATIVGVCFENDYRLLLGFDDSL